MRDVLEDELHKIEDERSVIYNFTLPLILTFSPWQVVGRLVLAWNGGTSALGMRIRSEMFTNPFWSRHRSQWRFNTTRVFNV